MAEADPEAGLHAQLHQLAVQFVLPGRLPDVDQAIRLACELIVHDLETPATISMAALSYGTTLRDSEPLIRDMLSEQGVPLPEDDATEPERFDFVLRAFASGGIGVGDMSTVLFHALPSWEDQTEVQRALLRLTIELDHETCSSRKAAIVAAMRAIAAGRVDAATAAPPFRLKIETAFQITGRGTVIAGVIEQGTLHIGDELELVQSAEDGRTESRLTRCIGIGGIRETGRDPALGAPIGVIVSGLAPHDVRPGGRLQHR